ncbi:MAG: CBS and ACT domain-containing protein [Desulfobacteraceae bacterium]|jgi:acetoin utilization protein AcuB
MLVKNWMSRNVETVGPDDSMLDAVNRIREHKILMLPVMDGGKLVGVITDRDIKRASASDASTLEIHELMYLISKIKVRDIMSKKVVTVPEDFTVEETAEVLLENRISGVPVVDREGKITGVITQADIFRVLISITGVEKRGIQFAFLLEDKPGSIKAVADVMRTYGGRIASILTSYEEASEGYRKAFIRMYGLDRFKLEELKKELKDKFHVLYMVDNREEKREIYE